MKMHQPGVLPVPTQRAFQDLQTLVRAANLAHRNESANIPVRTLCDLSDNLMLVEPARKRRDFKFRYVGDALIKSYASDFTGMSFGDLKQECVKTNEWKNMKKCLEAWVDAEEKAEPSILQSIAKLGVYRGNEITRLIMPIFKRGRVQMLAGAIIYRKQPRA